MSPVRLASVRHLSRAEARGTELCKEGLASLSSVWCWNQLGEHRPRFSPTEWPSHCRRIVRTSRVTRRWHICLAAGCTPVFSIAPDNSGWAKCRHPDQVIEYHHALHSQFVTYNVNLMPQ